MMHKCVGMPKEDIHVNFDGELLRNEKSWRLSVLRTATEADLEESQYLHEIGDTMWKVSVGISHCPYCGVELTKISGESRSAIGEKYLYDHQKWNMSVR
jgi:uncharacterized protein with PIN domain